MDRKRVLEKIQKALNLANNSAATPGEAAAALNSAQKLMAKFAVEEGELGLVGMSHEDTDFPVQAGQSFPEHLSHFLWLMRHTFGVRTVVRRTLRVSDYSWTVTYYGPEHRVSMAVYTHQVLFRAIEKGWLEKVRAYGAQKRGARLGYYIGWIHGVSKQVNALVMDPSEEDAIERYLKQQEGELDKTKQRKVEYDKRSALLGMSDAKKFSIHRPMEGTENLKLGVS